MAYRMTSIAGLHAMAKAPVRPPRVPPARVLIADPNGEGWSVHQARSIKPPRERAEKQVLDLGPLPGWAYDFEREQAPLPPVATVDLSHLDAARMRGLREHAQTTWAARRTQGVKREHVLRLIPVEQLPDGKLRSIKL